MKLITSNLKLKLKGKHTTIIGGRYGYKVINNICKHDKIKSIIPSIIICKNKIRNNKDHAKSMYRHKADILVQSPSAISHWILPVFHISENNRKASHLQY